MKETFNEVAEGEVFRFYRDVRGYPYRKVGAEAHPHGYMLESLPVLLPDGSEPVIRDRKAREE